MFKAFQNDFLMAHLLHVQLVEVIDGDVEQAAAGNIVVDEEMTVRKNWIVQTCGKQRKIGIIKYK